MIQTINPYTQKLIKEYEPESEEEIYRKIKDIRKAQPEWAKTEVDDRISFLKELENRIIKNQKSIAESIAIEMGKPITQNYSEIERSINLIHFARDNFKKFLDSEYVSTEAKKSYVRFDPLGVVLGIEPWNVPLWQALKPSIPAIIAGNGFLLKHSSIVSGTSKLIEELFDIPVFKSTITHGETALSAIKYVDAVALTGSTETGSKVGEMCGRNIKKAVLELGGSDPFIVLESANIEKAAKQAAQARLLNAGQRCVASKRFIISEKVFDQFYEYMKEEFYKVIAGDPLDQKTFLGPLSSKEAYEKVSTRIEELKTLGVVETAYGQKLVVPFIPPTIAIPSKDYQEEIFGPVAILSKFKNLSNAISKANDSSYGLGATIWGDPSEAEEIAPYIQAGSVFINKVMASDPRLPFGGIKKSGIGREHSWYGLHEFTNIKSVWVGDL